MPEALPPRRVDAGPSLDAGAGQEAGAATDGGADAEPGDAGSGSACPIGDGGAAALEQALGDASCDRVLLPAGTIEGSFVIERSVVLAGAGREETILDGGGVARVLEAAGDIDVVIEDLTIQRGSAIQGAGLSLVEGRFTLRRVNVEDNHLGSEGWRGAGVHAEDVETLRLEDARIEDNTAGETTSTTVSGLGLFATGSNVYLDANTVIAHNRARTDTGSGAVLSAAGAGIRILGGSAVIDGAAIHDNEIHIAQTSNTTLTGRGAGVACGFATLELRAGTEIRDNSITVLGSGEVHTVRPSGAGLDAEQCAVTAVDARIGGNTLTYEGLDVSSASGSGGGVDAVGGSLELERVLVEANAVDATVAGFAGTPTVGGGGIAGRGTQLVLQGCTVRDNTVTSVAVTGTPSSPMGAGIRAWVANNETAEVRVLGSTISGNGISVTGGAGVITAIGGGLSAIGAFSGSSLTVSLVNSTLSGNRIEVGSTGTGSQQAYGSALYARGNSADNPVDVDLRNVTITGNAVEALPSPIGAESEGGALALQGSVATVAVSHSILHGNTASADADCKTLLGGALTSLGHNLVGDESTCGFTEVSDSDDAPLLAPLADNGGPTLTHALLAGSPAINGGHPAGCMDGNGDPITVDQRGEPRGAVCDLGAYELQP